MKRLKSILQGLAIAAFIVGTENLIAGDKSAPKDVPEPSVAAAWQRRIADFRSDGIPLDELVNRLRMDFPELNFMVKEKARSEGVSAQLRSVTLEEILKAIEPGTEERVRVIWPTNNNDRLVIFDKGHGSRAAIDPATGLPMPGTADEKACRVFSLSKYLASRADKDADAAIKELREALENAWQMLRRANGQNIYDLPELSFHRGTKLLIAVGRPEDLSILEQLVKELQGSGPSTSEIASKPAYYRLWLDLMKERVAQAESISQLGLAEDELKRAEELRKNKVVSEAQYQVKRAAVEVLNGRIAERSNLLERIDADLKNFALPEPGRGVGSSKP